MNYSNLIAYTQNSGEVLAKLTPKNSIISKFVMHTGYFPGNVSMKLFDGGGTLGDCCEPGDSGEWNEATIKVDCFKKELRFCISDFARFYQDSAMRFGANTETPGATLEAYINEQMLANVAKVIDKVIFTSDSASGGKIDGLIKQAAGAPAAQKLNITDGNIFDAISAVINALPADAFDLGTVGVFVGTDVAKSLMSSLVKMNLYHFNTYNPAAEQVFLFPGTDVQIIPTSGLNGTNTIIATPVENVHWLTNMEADYTSAKWIYNEPDEEYIWRVKFLLGVGFGYLDYVATATISPAVLTTPPCVTVCAA